MPTLMAGSADCGVPIVGGAAGAVFLVALIVARIIRRRRKQPDDEGDGQESVDPVDPDRLHPETLRILIEGEQKLLAVFDARQASADAKLTAAATGALALPAAVLALRDPLGVPPETLRCGYGVVVVLVSVVFLLRMWGGWKPSKGRKISTESPESKDARDVWWASRGSERPETVQARALALWRTRAEHSREIAQDKDFLAFLGGTVFVIALLLMAALVADV